MKDISQKSPCEFVFFDTYKHDEVASRAKSKSLITKASKIVHFSTLWCFLEQVCNGGINKIMKLRLAAKINTH